MNRVRKNPQLSRRHFLRAAGGAAVALPLLSSLRAGAAGETFPKRLVLMYTPNGVIPDAWWPLNVTSETSWDLNTIHKPLAPFKDRLLFLNGVDLEVDQRAVPAACIKGASAGCLPASSCRVESCSWTAAVSTQAGPTASASISRSPRRWPSARRSRASSSACARRKTTCKGASPTPARARRCRP